MKKRKLHPIDDYMRFIYNDMIQSIINNPDWDSICTFCLKYIKYNNKVNIHALCLCVETPRIAHESCIEFQEDLRIKKAGDILFKCPYCQIQSVLIRKLASKKYLEIVKPISNLFWTFFTIIIYIIGYINYCRNIGKLLIVFNEEISFENKENIITNTIYKNIISYPIILELIKGIYQFSLGAFTLTYGHCMLLSEAVQIIIVLLGIKYSLKFGIIFVVILGIEFYFFLITSFLLKDYKADSFTILLSKLNIDIHFRKLIKKFSYGFFKIIIAIIIKNILMGLNFSLFQWILLFIFLFQINYIFIMYFSDYLRNILRNANLSPSL